MSTGQTYRTHAKRPWFSLSLKFKTQLIFLFSKYLNDFLDQIKVLKKLELSFLVLDSRWRRQQMYRHISREYEEGIKPTPPAKKYNKQTPVGHNANLNNRP